MESVASQEAMKGYQVRFQHDDKHQREIKEAIDLAKGDTTNCFGKGQGVRAIVFEGRAEGGRDLRVDGNHSVNAASLSKHCHMIGVISCLLYTSPSPRDRQKSRMPSSA